MSHEHSAPDTPSFSRRGFLESALLTAGATALPRLFERRSEAADEKEKPVEVGHPLDPLSKAEMADAVKVLREGRKLADSFRFVSCLLLEPPKQVLRDHRPGRPVPRQAFLVLLDNTTGTGYEAVVDLKEKKVVRFDALPKGVQPAIMLDEFSECEKA